ncbi:26S proteasome regulatory subunit N7 [Nematocida sp. AWRm80]|nr:26S proteasome regulatory subunit N7 [Nematocida sp. AWRm80]
MEYILKRPSLEARGILKGVREKRISEEELVKYLLENEMYGLLEYYESKQYITIDSETRENLNGYDKNIVNKTDVNEIPEDISEEELIEILKVLSSRVEYPLYKRVYNILTEKNRSIIVKYDIYITEIRMLLLLEEESQIKGVINRINNIIDLGIDWNRKNKYKVYQGLVSLLSRDYSGCSIFLECISTFDCRELFEYDELILYCIYIGIMTLSRQEIKKKLIDSSEVCEVVKNIPGAFDLVNNYYECNYGSIFKDIYVFSTELVNNINITDIDYFIYTIKVRLYTQLLTSYKAISIDQMSSIFGVSLQYIQNDLEEMILRKDISCKINHNNNMIYNIQNENITDIAAKTEGLSHVIQKIISS